MAIQSQLLQGKGALAGRMYPIFGAAQDYRVLLQRRIRIRISQWWSPPFQRCRLDRHISGALRTV